MSSRFVSRDIHVEFPAMLRAWLATGLSLLLIAMAGAAVAAGPSAARPASVVAGEQAVCMADSDGRWRCRGYAARASILSNHHFTAMSIGPFDLNCGLKTDGSALCWGFSSPDPDTIATPGPFRAVSAGGDYACGLLGDGRVQCWGSPVTATLRTPTVGTYRSVAAGYGGVCALRADGTVECWENQANTALPAVPAGRFQSVGVGDRYACALTLEGRIACWGQNNYDGQKDAPTDAGYVSLSVGVFHACALRDSGTAVCWGRNSNQEATPPSGVFTDVTAGRSFSCGRRGNGTVDCWGAAWFQPSIGYPEMDDPFSAPVAQIAMGGGQACARDALGSVLCTPFNNTTAPLDGRFHTISLGTSGGCGIDRADRLRCWGTTPPGAPAGAMQAVSVGTGHACAIRKDGGAQCWGDNAAGQTATPPGRFVEIAAADTYSCGLQEGGAVVCWGQGAGLPRVPTGSGHRSLSANARRVCVHTAAGRLQCWGVGAAEIPASFLNATWDAVANSDAMVCGLTKPYSVVCARQDGSQFTPLPQTGQYEGLAASGLDACTRQGLRAIRCSRGLFFGPTRPAGPGELALGAAHACNLRADGGLSCYGDDTYAQRQAPAQSFKAIDANANHTCALGADHRLHCWGDAANGGSQPPTTALRDFDVGQTNGCGIGADGAVLCWGWNVNGQGNPPAGTFRQVATGLNHSCGVRDTGALACWGYGADGQTSAPAGQFIMVDVGERHSCAIAVNGQLRCWGLNTEGQSTPPQVVGATYRALSVGAFHACAVRSTGETACWGRSAQGQTAAPATGRYVDIAAGTATSCAIREDGIRVCWGSNANAQVPALAVVSTTLPRLRYGNAYSWTLGATGQSGYLPVGPEFTLASGALPTGLTLRADGLLSGQSTAYGQFPFVVQVRDDNGVAATYPAWLSNMPFTGGPSPYVPVRPASSSPPTRPAALPAAPVRPAVPVRPATSPRPAPAQSTPSRRLPVQYELHQDAPARASAPRCRGCRRR